MYIEIVCAIFSGSDINAQLNFKLYSIVSLLKSALRIHNHQKDSQHVPAVKFIG